MTDRLTVARATDLDLDPAGGAWVTICDTHGTIANSRTRALASAAVGVDFCDGCREDRDAAKRAEDRAGTTDGATDALHAAIQGNPTPVPGSEIAPGAIVTDEGVPVRVRTNVYTASAEEGQLTVEDYAGTIYSIRYGLGATWTPLAWDADTWHAWCAEWADA